MPQPNSTDYVIGESDVLAINVWHEQELSRVLPVRADGKISLPLIGDLAAGGSTPAQLQAAIVEKLRSYMENPEVTVIVQEPRSQYFTVVGEVMKPGAYPLGQRLSVLDGIAMAGGFKDFAKVKKMYVIAHQPRRNHARDCPSTTRRRLAAILSRTSYSWPGTRSLSPRRKELI